MGSYLSKVPTLDISKFTNGDNDDIKNFSDDLGSSFNQTGFAIIKNHGLTQEVTSNLYSTIQSFFKLDDEKKIKYVKKNKLTHHTHYVRTPYTIKEPLIMKFNENFHIDIGQGLSNLIKELKVTYKK